MTISSPEKGLGSAGTSPEKGSSVTMQPAKTELASILTEINDMVGEAPAANPGEQWSGTSGTTGVAQTTSGAASGMSARDQAIAAIPQPAVIQRELATHIRMEVKQLRKQALTVARMSKPGAAYKLNQLYARIHRLNGLLGDLFEASYEALKRMFIRVFIDKQPIL